MIKDSTGLAFDREVRVKLNYYNKNAKHLFGKYQSLNPDILHANWLKHLPLKSGLALDVGGGSGRDSNWLAKKGWEVIAVEPSKALMELGKKATKGYKVKWVDDSLPELSKLKMHRQSFSLILVNAVLMHLPQQLRDASIEKLSSLMTEGSVLIITLRQGPNPETRKFYEVSPDEIVRFAQKKGLQVEVNDTVPDRLGRDGVVWQTIIIKSL